MSYQDPQEPQEHDVIFAIVALVGCVFLCFWPNVLRYGLHSFGKHIQTNELRTTNNP